jgi:hypothetical protein
VKGFGAGFRSRSPLVLLVAAALLIAALLGFDYLFTSGAWTSVPMKYWMRKASDDYTFVSWTVGANKQHPPKTPAVYLLGGSTAREAITSGDSLAADIERRGGPKTVAWDLGSINQNFAQSLAIADNVPNSPAWILIGLNVGRFTPDRGANMEQVVGRELLLKSAFLQQYVARQYGRYRYSRTILPGIFSYFTSYVDEHGAELLKGSVPTREYGQHRYNLKHIHTVAQKERMVAIWNKRRYAVFKRNLAFNLAMLEQLLIRCQERGLHPVLVELPNNRDLIGERLDYAAAQYQKPAHALAAKYDVPYVDFNRELAIPNADFHDLSHLVEPGRVIWQDRLAEELVRLMGADGEGAGTPP